MKLERSWAPVVSTSVRIVSIWIVTIRILAKLILLLVWLAVRVVILLLRSSVRSALRSSIRTALRSSVRACIEAALLSVEGAHAKVVLRSSAVWTLLRRSTIWIGLLRRSVRILNLTKIGGGDSSSIRLAHRLGSVSVVSLLACLPRRGECVAHVTHHIQCALRDLVVGGLSVPCIFQKVLSVQTSGSGRILQDIIEPFGLSVNRTVVTRNLVHSFVVVLQKVR